MAIHIDITSHSYHAQMFPEDAMHFVQASDACLQQIGTVQWPDAADGLLQCSVLARNGTAAFLFLFDALYTHVQLQIDKRDQQWKDHILAMHFTCRLPISVS